MVDLNETLAQSFIFLMIYCVQRLQQRLATTGIITDTLMDVSKHCRPPRHPPLTLRVTNVARRHPLAAVRTLRRLVTQWVC